MKPCSSLSSFFIVICHVSIHPPNHWATHPYAVICTSMYAHPHLQISSVWRNFGWILKTHWSDYGILKKVRPDQKKFQQHIIGKQNLKAKQNYSYWRKETYDHFIHSFMHGLQVPEYCKVQHCFWHFHWETQYLIITCLLPIHKQQQC